MITTTGKRPSWARPATSTANDIIDIIVKQPAAARFLSRHLYSYFVGDEVGVPSWMNTPPVDPDTIKMLEDEYFRSGIQHTLDAAGVVSTPMPSRTPGSAGSRAPSRRS